MGSCTCGVACINTNRNFIGIENDKKHFNVSLKRIMDKSEEKEFTLISSFMD
jgi:DNA modification methylase